MLLNILIFLFGLIVLVKGADFFIESIAKIAKKFGVSDFLIGLTLTSIGTSLPELASSISASMGKHFDLVIGNIVGSNIANIGLIIGITAIIKPFKTTKKMYQRDGHIMIATVLLFFFFSLDNYISKIESVILLLVYIFYTLFILKSDDTKINYRFHDFMNYVFNMEYLSTIKSRLIKKAMEKPESKRTLSENRIIQLFREGIIKDIIISAISLYAVIYGAGLLVKEAIILAEIFNVSHGIIALSLVAIGTSLPELVVSITAVKKGFNTLITGNVLGSNIANICLIIGISGLINPIAISEKDVSYTIPIMLFFSLAFLQFIRSDWKIERKQGVLLLAAYIVFIFFAFLR